MLSLHAIFFVALLIKMKVLVFIITLFQTTTPDYFIKNDYRYSKSEKRFIKNVVQMQNESPENISKNGDGTITIEFSYYKYILRKDGFMGETYIKEDNNWLSLGNE